MKQIEQVYVTPFLILILFCYLVAGVLNVVWLPGEVASPLIILGGASGIYFYFSAKSFEQRSLSLLSFVLSNILIFYVFQMPDPCSFLVGLFLIFLTAGHLFLWLSSEVFFNFIFFVVLLSRIFFHQKMGEWGFGLVTEFMFLSLLFELKKNKKSEEGSRIFPVLDFLPLFLIAFLYNFLFLDCSLKQILCQMNFLFAAAALLFFSLFAETIKELIISFLLYVIDNCSIGYFLAESIMTFSIVTSVFLFSNGVFASFFFLKAKMEKRPLSDILLANNREGIHIVLVVYFLVLGVLLTQLKLGGSADLSLYSNWLFGLGIQIGYLSVFHYFFRKSNERDL